MKLLNKISKLDAHHRSLVSILISFLFFIFLNSRLNAAYLLLILWDVFALSTLILSWITLTNTEISQIRITATKQDPSRTTIFTLIIIASCISLLAVGFVLNTAKGAAIGILSSHIILAALSVICSWILIHTLYSLRYAHVFYGDKNKPAEKDYHGGLDFPGEKKPDYMDFAYFSFVIGMTFQVSDVQITSKRMRRLVLLHGIISFGFNTVILALVINIIASLL